MRDDLGYDLLRYRVYELSIDADDLLFDRQPVGRSATGFDGTLEELERVHIDRVLREEGGRVANAAVRLGTPRSTLYQKIKKLGISLPDS